MLRRTFTVANQPVKSVKKDDTVKVITGKFKGQTGKVLAVSHKARTVQIEGLGIVTRHIKPSQFNPRGGEKQVHTALDVSKVVKVEATKPAAKPAKTTTKKETK